MDSSHYRKIELQSAADFTYLHSNTVALSRQKLDLHLPPSAAPNNEPDPMRERVRELVDDFITRTFTSASASVSINGLDSSSPEFPFPAAFNAPTELETVEYEPFDGKLAARVASLYAQLESLTTTVAQLRRDAPRRAAREYAKELGRIIEEEDKEFDDEEEDDADVEMNDADADRNQDQLQAQPEEDAANINEGEKRRRGKVSGKKEWNLNLPLGTEQEAERWRNGEMAEVYEDALRTLLRLQGEPVPGNDDAAMSKSDGVDGNALASTVGKAERAGRAVEFVEKI
ncbi:kinetochore protein Mis14 like-domain-containing protein [Aspergillus nidulans var. acristatus]